ncbi:hypothetical protein Vqi01_30960 [Micromonospora qiuiae]|uniref:Rossmann fold nucleotide-binding protein n=1 Tax=Micromonospora qiuiae TaxID=502268 RepID=A0ABQ4JCQ9_9ACTN|nr:hypothetical protein [Micromonospora qiuiae]GIJ27934.1 hypothetical protein Vqi01_30960 [Micromonospora qiuiae]
MPTPPPADVIEPHTWTNEIQTRSEFDRRLATGSLVGLTIQGLQLNLDPVPDFTGVEVAGTLFVGCRFASRQVGADLVQRGANVVPPFSGLPYPTQPPHLYTPEELAAGFAEGGFEAMYDTRVYAHFRAHGGALPDVREALGQRLHDHGVDNALADATRTWLTSHGPQSVVGVMGGHAVPRGSASYRMAAVLGRELARAHRLVVTGGGPGVMEAANLGAYLSTRPAEELSDAIDLLATAPDFTDHDRYTAAALKVREVFGQSITPPGGGSEPVTAFTTYRADSAALTSGDLDWASCGGLAIPTWLYGHEPANLFAGRIAKYFSNAIREDTILRLARGGIVFAPGRAGTVQEVFQAATKTYYGTDGVSGAYVFLDRRYWTEELPVESLLRPLLATSPFGDLSDTVHLTDDAHEAVHLLTR